ncbi:hypothetical protein CBER1_04786 [Cercospora berteroae]|uniref:DUF3140 domain-containing protein n=1 Tax=Cercospora berteroae TaxID=357750 RepID=A0A2S6CCX4_9PEZI|nr:hypothetical protein CBER1_04786 [Cercospora berteroae]
MVKDNDTVIEEFNDIVNMSAKDLQDWLDSEESTGAGWDKDDGSGETIGHERSVFSPISRKIQKLTNYTKSGRKIVKILEDNPKKDPENYSEEDIAHMRKVVAYCKRHLAQEGKAKQDPNSKSAKSLKNWGHDPQKS